MSVLKVSLRCVAPVALAVLLAACGHDGSTADAGNDEATASQALVPATGPAMPDPTAMPPANPPDDQAPAAEASVAPAAAPIAAGPPVDPDLCHAEVAAGDTLAFDPPSLDIPRGCRTFTLTLRHTGKLPVTVMGHNLVIAKAADIAGVARNSLGAGPIRNYVEPSDRRVIARSKVVGGGGTASVKIDVAKLLAGGGGYAFFCSFPGHARDMRGTINLR